MNLCREIEQYNAAEADDVGGIVREHASFRACLNLYEEDLYERVLNESRFAWVERGRQERKAVPSTTSARSPGSGPTGQHLVSQREGPVNRTGLIGGSNS